MPRLGARLRLTAGISKSMRGLTLPADFWRRFGRALKPCRVRLKAGVLCGFRKPALRRVRRWPVNGFENWLIFYIPKRNGVEIVHIVHGARDIQSLLDT